MHYWALTFQYRFDVTELSWAFSKNLCESSKLARHFVLFLQLSKLKWIVLDEKGSQPVSIESILAFDMLINHKSKWYVVILTAARRSMNP